MLLQTVPENGLAFPGATGEDWARFDAITFAAAAERRENEKADDRAP